MTITKQQISKWIDDESRRVDPTRARDDHDRNLILRILREPNLTGKLTAVRLEHLVWNLAWAMAFAPKEDPWAAEAAKAAPKFLAFHFAETTTYPDALSMFWEVVIGPLSRGDAAFHDAVFRGLCSQLKVKNSWVQASALHGFGHLRDPRCRPVIREFLKVSTDDAKLAAYAREAMAFKIL
ncbi:MAG: hypothetical protein AB7N24_18640 [Dehalococcoidia bacterium]